MKKILYGPSAEHLSVPETKLPASLEALVTLACERAIEPTLLRSAAGGDLDAIEVVGRTLASEEGRLLEAVVTTLARTNAHQDVLTGMKLPVLRIAAELAERNKLDAYNRLSVDPESQSSTSYHPDLVLVERPKRSAIIIDVKRSLGGYSGGGSLAKLQKRMEAAACVLPEILWRDHQRLAVETVGIAIIDGARTSAGIDDGIWSISRLDDLIGVAGAGSAARSALKAFRSTFRDRWLAALPSLSEGEPPMHVREEAHPSRLPEEQRPRKRGRPSRHQPPAGVTIGFYRPDAKRVH
ncbi:hypothetical protein [Pseudorhizobium flavum]|uniref:hypothetical protein n=1 Tax=Pseudorhizobium flavum TaxID=1335061 RepID=UPI0024934D10|nr:hypothetical protein [Pseudorhizobium flavum]